MSSCTPREKDEINNNILRETPKNLGQPNFLKNLSQLSTINKDTKTISKNKFTKLNFDNGF